MIFNRTKKEKISEREKYCHNLFSQGWGLMFSKRKNLVMVFNKERKVRLRSWFVFYQIDVLILDKDKEIVEIERGFKPFGFWSSEKKGKYVVEMGFKGRYRAGDKLEFKV